MVSDLVTFTRYCSGMWADVLAVLLICFVDVNFFNDLGFWLSLPAIPTPALLSLLAYCGMAFAVLAVLLPVAPNFLSCRKQPGIAAP